MRRRKEGIWFFNNGEPTYLTGGHYFILMWCQLWDNLNQTETTSAYGSYMEFQRNYAYFIEVCKATNLGSGGDVVKSKKTGITMFQALLCLAEAITTRNGWYRVMSTKEDVAKETAFKYTYYALERLIPILTPEYRSNSTEIHFENSQIPSKRSFKKQSATNFLDSHFTTISTIVNAFDSGKNRIAWVDEQSKIEFDTKNTVETLHNITIATVWQGMIRVGYVIYTHYVSEKNNDSFRLAKKIFYNSRLKTVTEASGTTKSGLLAYAMFAQDGIFGGCDKYGKAIPVAIIDYINKGIAQRKGDPASIRAWRRQFPMSLEDAWTEGAGELSIFDNVRLGMKLHSLVEGDSVTDFKYINFDFKWTSDPQIEEIKEIYKFPGQVKVNVISEEDKAKDSTKGVFKWYRPEWTPGDFISKYANRITVDEKGNKAPYKDCPFYMAVDPTQYSQAKEVAVGSQNAIQIFLLPNAELNGYFGEYVSNIRLMVEYLYRPDSPRDTLMHVIQCLMYFGCYALIESNAAWLYTRLKEMGFGNFLIVTNKETGALEPYKKNREQKPFTSQRSVSGGKDTIDEYVTAGKMHLNEPDPIDHIKYLDSADVISQLMNFDPANTKIYDAAVCYLIGLLGVNTYLGWRQKEMQRQNAYSSDSVRIAATILR